MNVLMELKGIEKSFSGQMVLQGIDLTVHSGDLIHIQGKNGCGKSTLFKVITDLLKADSGSILKNESINIGALIENPGFIETASLRKNLEFLASIKSDEFPEKQARKLCNVLNLPLDSKVKLRDYSLGMRQKAGIIQALFEDQNLILLDEPTRGLDGESIEGFCSLIKEEIRMGKAVIIASHDFQEDLPYSRNLILEDGKLKAR